LQPDSDEAAAKIIGEKAEMTEPEACANCEEPDIASPEAGWVTGKPASFKRSPRHRDREMLYLCPSCFKNEMFARGLYEDQLIRRLRGQFGYTGLGEP
jgi:hypothetical protein